MSNKTRILNNVSGGTEAAKGPSVTEQTEITKERDTVGFKIYGKAGNVFAIENATPDMLPSFVKDNIKHGGGR